MQSPNMTIKRGYKGSPMYANISDVKTLENLL